MRWSLLVLCAVVVCGCRCGGDSPPDGGTDAGADGGVDAGADAGVAYDEFDAWRELRDVVRASPDAVPGRAATLVAAKDARGLFALVRDDVALLPTTPRGFENAGTAIRWGARATLRGQAGTPRERAELLKDLYVAAGFPAEVVVGAPAAGSTVTALLAHGPQRAVRFMATDDRFAKWEATLPVDSSLPQPFGTPLDADGGVRAAILAQVTPLLPAPPAPDAFDATLPEVPLVRVVIDGGVTYANPNVDGAAFGEARTVDTPTPAAPVDGERQLRVTLSAARSANPTDVFTLVERTWPASEVAGRTVTVSFTTALSRAAAARVRVGEADAFIPLLVVRGDGLDDARMQALSAVGTPVTREGAKVEVAGGGLVIDGQPVAAGPTPDGDLTSVTTVEVSASAMAFPDVELLVRAKRRDGSRVSGLAADAFLVSEDGARMVAGLRSTNASAPRVVLLFDRSTSIPPEFLGGAATVGHAVADAIFTQFPGALVQVAAIDLNGPTLAGGFVDTLTAVDAQLATLSGTGSELWTALDTFADTGATAVVAITDAVTDDAETANIASRLVAGPPVLVAGVGTVDATTGQRIATLTRGRFLPAVTAASLPGDVTAFLAERTGFDYRIVYRAPAGGAATRQVSVAIRAPGTATGSGSYVPPATPVLPPALSALYLTIETDGHAVTRRLAGGPGATQADREEVAGALFGRFVLGVEGGAPSFSTLLDEVLAERLALEPLTDALRANDAAAIAAAAKRSLWRTPTDVRWVAAALPGEEAPGDVTFADGLTVTLQSNIPVLGQKVLRRLDLLPLVPRETVDFTGASAARRTTERTAMLAAFESERFARSTRPALMGETLGLYDPLTVDGMLGAGWNGVAYPAYSDYDVLAPADGTPVAFWAVHKRTGELIGVLPNGGEGESESTQALVDRLTFILDVAARAGEAYGYEGVAHWAQLESTKVSLLGSVIMLFEGEGPDPAGDAENQLCSFGIDTAGGPIPGWSGLGTVPGDVGLIYRAWHLITNREVPDVPSPSGLACSAILGGN
ncbi:MAG: hypothetical protein AB1730_22755 [Myxococcota bacterium]|jgi:hypothetical protein